LSRLAPGESRLGTVDEHWLDEAELIFVEARYLGTLKRQLLIKGLHPTTK